ncbi:D-alanyl-D-alanine carboxypeptidase [bacterium]|nr:MAG: D-alanyl-D-alanine carboxypeptidase [bacterium]
MPVPLVLHAPSLPKPSASAVLAKSAVVVDAASGKVLWKRDPDTPRYPASTTKIMTVLLLLERCSPDEIIKAPSDIEKVKEASMNLKPGEKITAADMGYAMLLRSANDGCVATAVHISGSVPAFAKLMNERAKEMGLTHTYFHNPNGLNDTLHKISAHDLAMVGREAMKREDFREIARTYKRKITRSINKKDEVMVSKNKWLKKDPSADGIKTGYTKPAGLTYVGSVNRKGFRIIDSIMNTENWQADHKALLDWTYKTYEETERYPASTILGTASIEGGVQNTVPYAASEFFHVLARRGQARSIIEFHPKEGLTAPITKGQALGDVTVTDAEGFVQTLPVYATEAIEPVRFVAAVGNTFDGRTVAVGGALFGGFLLMRRRTRKTYARFRI